MGRTVKNRYITALLVGVLMLVSPQALAADHDKLVVNQDAPTLVSGPNVEPNNTGAVVFFGAVLRNSKDKKIGELIGQITTLDITVDGVEEEDRFRELVFNMDKGQIVVLGASQYLASDAPEFANDRATVTAVIVGGTGKYFGASGTVSTKQRKNGTYRHTFRFVD